MELQGLEAALDAVQLLGVMMKRLVRFDFSHFLDTSGVSGFFVASAWRWGYTSRVRGTRMICLRRKWHLQINRLSIIANILLHLSISFVFAIQERICRRMPCERFNASKLLILFSRWCLLEASACSVLAEFGLWRSSSKRGVQQSSICRARICSQSVQQSNHHGRL